MNKTITKSKAPIVAGIVAAILAIFKFIVGITSGSLSVLSSAIDSMLDCIVSVLNYFALKKSTAEPDHNFNYGYSKVEALMALFEGIFIVAIGAFIFYSSIDKIFHPGTPINLNSALLVMIVSIIATGVLILFLSKEYKRTASLIIKADTLHYKTDFLTNLGIIAALIIIKITGLEIIDAIFGVIISGYIAINAFSLIKDSIYILLDGSIDKSIVKDIENIIKSQKDVESYHYLRTRKSVNFCFLNVHLVFNPNISLEKAHEIGDTIENEIIKKYPQFIWNMDIHFDPRDDSDPTFAKIV